MNNKLRAWDHFNEIMVYSNEDDAVFILHENKWKIKYTREKTLQNGDVEIDAPVWEESDDVEVMRFSGLQDRNKKDIYDGDIVKGVGEHQGQSPVFFDTNCLCYQPMSYLSDNNGSNYEVIGNIHQHPNLLK